MIEENLTEEHGPLFLPILLLGVLSMSFAEVFAGSSILWFFSPWALFVTLPLYLTHTMFFLNLALRLKKYSLGNLYLWGVLFGLYESWITKVLWSGYPGSEDGAAFGLVFGIAIIEFSTLVLFYHNIYAFILPILAFATLSMRWRGADTADTPFLRQMSMDLSSKRVILFFSVILLLFAGPALAFNSGFNIINSSITILGSVGLIYFLDWRIDRKEQYYSIHSLKLGRKGMILLTEYMILQYVVFFIFLERDKLPTEPLPYLIIIGSYVVIILILLISKKVPAPRKMPPVFIQTISRRNIYRFFFAFLVVVVIMSIATFLTEIFFILVQVVVVIFLAPYLLIRSIIISLKR